MSKFTASVGLIVAAALLGSCEIARKPDEVGLGLKAPASNMEDPEIEVSAKWILKNERDAPDLSRLKR